MLISSKVSANNRSLQILIVDSSSKIL